jgi:hypothetical protein
MQLKNKKPQNIRDSLALATCTLLAGVAPQAAAFESPWEIDGGVLFYAEKDRVRLVEPVLQIRKEIDDGEFLTARFVADALTGASPNGAAPSDVPQTFTAPSGGKSYTTKAFEIPLDPTFEDTRGAASLDWEKPLSEQLRGIFGASFSIETDYTSFGLSASLARDFNQRNTTLTVATSVNFDSVSPEGGAPIGLSEMIAAVGDGEGEEEGEDDEDDGESKTIQEFLVGVTQVVSRNTLTQLNYSYGHSSGYLTDPYKILSVLNADGSLHPITTSPYVHEKRPDNRTFQTVYWKGIHQFGNEGVLTLVYRYGWDDWGINSNTYDVRYRHELGGGHYLQPHYRHYNQSAADFYRQALFNSELATLDYASADSRLGELTTKTIGLKYGVEFKGGGEFNIRVESMEQTGKTRAQDAVGKLQGMDLFPDNKATMVQLGVSMDTDTMFKRMATALLKITKR